jgi:hypothetical protein
MRPAFWNGLLSDEEDDGDTVGSMLRGFLALNKKDPLTGKVNCKTVRPAFWNGPLSDGDTVGSVLRGFLALNKKDPVNR